MRVCVSEKEEMVCFVYVFMWCRLVRQQVCGMLVCMYVQVEKENREAMAGRPCVCLCVDGQTNTSRGNIDNLKKNFHVQFSIHRTSATVFALLPNRLHSLRARSSNSPVGAPWCERTKKTRMKVRKRWKMRWKENWWSSFINLSLFSLRRIHIIPHTKTKKTYIVIQLFEQRDKRTQIMALISDDHHIADERTFLKREMKRWACYLLTIDRWHS